MCEKSVSQRTLRVTQSSIALVGHGGTLWSGAPLTSHTDENVNCRPSFAPSALLTSPAGAVAAGAASPAPSAILTSLPKSRDVADESRRLDRLLAGASASAGGGAADSCCSCAHHCSISRTWLGLGLGLG